MREFEFLDLEEVAKAFLQSRISEDFKHMASMLSRMGQPVTEKTIKREVHGLTEREETKDHYYEIVEYKERGIFQIDISFDTVDRPEQISLFVIRSGDFWVINDVEWGFPD